MLTIRPAFYAGLLFFAALFAGTCTFAAGEEPGDLVKRADSLKTANNTEFQALLKQLDAMADRLTPAQRDYVDYLKGWQSSFQGNYEASSAALQAVINRTQDTTIRARALITLLNSQALASHYEEAYANLSKLLDFLPQIQDQTARNFSYGVAAILYNQAGQYDLAIQYADLWRLDSSDKTAPCKAGAQKVESLYGLGKLAENDSIVSSDIEACQQIGDVLWANNARAFQGQVLVNRGDAVAALALLSPHNEEVLATHSAAFISKFHALSARAYLMTGDLAHAREYALSAIDQGIKQAYSKAVADAYETLYEVSKQQGDSKSALEYHEKYAAADKAYLNDTSARALAYQMVHQQVLDKKREIEALNEKNRVLGLQQQVDAKAAEIRLLYIGLLVMGLSIVATWAYRTKLSQLKFQKLARRDGLTGIFNRQHFIESAQDTLRYCAKASRAASLLVLDLDHFKMVNDTHGHAAGDAALKRAVAACQSRLRSIDLFGRLGGEEFGILLPDCAEGAATERANEMREAIAASRRSGDAIADVPVTASFGVVATHACGYDLTTLLANADSALYASKNGGRNRVTAYAAPVTSAVSA